MSAPPSVCPGCAHEEACGHAEATACANREPAGSPAPRPLGTPGCSCEGYREAMRRAAEAVQAQRRLVSKLCKTCRWCYGADCTHCDECWVKRMKRERGWRA